MFSTRSRRHAVALTVAASILGSTFGAQPPAAADSDGRRVIEWVDTKRVGLTSIDPMAPLDDLTSLHQIAGGATVVGLGESTHGSHEQFRVKHRMVRHLVEHQGFRTVALEDDFGSGLLLDRYVTTGAGDPRQLVARMSSPFWAADETVELLEWMRTYNTTHRDQVRVLGTDLLWLRQASFDAIAAHVAEVAPERLDELDSLFEPIRLQGQEWEQFEWYRQQSDAEKQGRVAGARRLEVFVGSLPSGGDAVTSEYARQHARAIAGWYDNYAVTDGFRGGRERFIADSIAWWQHLVDGGVVYWAANAHTAAADALTYRTPDESLTGTMAGGILEERLRDRYVSIGTVFHHGSISSNHEAPGPQAVGPPPEAFLEGTLGHADSNAFLLDLPDRGSPQAVRHWLSQPSTMRVILPFYAEPQDAAEYNMTVPALGDAFDAVVFVRHTSPLVLRQP